MVIEAVWKPLNPESLVAAPCLIEQTLCQPNEGEPQFAKDFQYASAVLDAWKAQELADDEVWKTEWSSILYQQEPQDGDKDGQPLCGHLVRSTEKADQVGVPGIILFHTGAGPHDLFLLWKAAALVNAMPCVVLIADILGDDSGWAWSSDRSKYNAAREKVLATVDGERPLLQKRIQAAHELLSGMDGVNESRIGVLGWCLGGHPVLELSRMRLESIKAMATFHGVFDNLPAPTGNEDAEATSAGCEVLICHGVEDPFVTDTMLEQALATLQHGGYRTSLLQLQARHGFSNPAQDFNENEAFTFNQEAADKSWRQATALLRRNLES